MSEEKAADLIGLCQQKIETLGKAGAHPFLNALEHQRRHVMTHVTDRRAEDEETIQMDRNHIDTLACGRSPAAEEDIHRPTVLMPDLPSIREGTLFPCMKTKSQ